MDEIIRKYMAEIGKKGGQANKGKRGTSEKCRAAAQARWEKYRKDRDKKELHEEDSE